jgi:hypothetical protein
MSTIRGYVGTDISADTGEVEVIPAPVNIYALGVAENIVTLRMRMRTNVPQDPYLGGQMLATVRWNDGNAVQEWNMGLSTYADNYAELPQEIWADMFRAVTIQVQPLVAGGSVDVLLDYVEL